MDARKLNKQLQKLEKLQKEEASYNAKLSKISEKIKEVELAIQEQLLTLNKYKKEETL